MAKATRPPKPSQDNSTTVVLVIGSIIVVALLAFSLSRVMRKSAATTPVADTAGQSQVQPPVSTGSATTPQTESAPSLPPMASPRAGTQTPVAADSSEFVAEAGATKTQLAAVPRTKPVDLLQKMEGKQVTIIDVRDADSYQARHIPGALHIPLQYIAGEVPYLPKDKPIVTYCT